VPAPRKVAALLVPWAFVALFGVLYATFLLPKLSEGHVATLCLGAFVTLVFVVAVVTAVIFSRDVLLDRWP
jgi:hypothetical protein